MAPDEWNLEDTTHILQIQLSGGLGDPKNDGLGPKHFEQKNGIVLRASLAAECAPPKRHRRHGDCRPQNATAATVD